MFTTIGTGLFGARLLHIPETKSTNDDLRDFLRHGTPSEGTVITTDFQTAGKGRMGRTWLAPRDSSLLFSILFRPTFLQLERMFWLNAICSLSMVWAIKEETGLELQVKWPNDIVAVSGKKICGTLVESQFLSGVRKFSWVIVGMGLNVNLDPKTDFANAGELMPDFKTGDNLPPSETATSLSVLLNRDVADLRKPILKSFLNNLEDRYLLLRKDEYPLIEYNCRLAGFGRPVIVHSTVEPFEIQGELRGVSDTGALQLKQNDSSIQLVRVGDLTLRQPV